MGLTMKRQALDGPALRAQLDYYETAYGVPSERRHEPFTHDGRLVETSDWRSWDHLYSIWRRVFAPAP